ncbi:hypothetical protein D5S17_24005 [Pseudonocardiaceae bacterium YIM PH 21723]|nr:hypothetical protein D5S17_24005 [Pseudonocardiaceae bacterium YIM PH 21723]
MSNPLDLAKAAVDSADQAGRAGDIPTAVQHMEQAVQLAQGTGDPVIEAEFTLLLARTLIDLPDLVRAQAVARQAIDLYGDHPDRYTALLVLARMRASHGDLPSARELAIEALGTPHPLVAADADTLLVHLTTDLDDHDAAITHAGSAIIRLQNARETARAAAAGDLLARTLGLAGRWEQAEQEALTFLPEMDRLGLTEQSVETRFLLAHIQTRLHHFEQAFETFNELLRLLEDNGTVDEYAKLISMRAVLMEEAELHHQAAQEFRTAADLHQKAGNPAAQMHHLHRALAGFHALDREEDIAEAVNAIDDLAIAQQNEPGRAFVHELTLVSLTMATIFLEYSEMTEIARQRAEGARQLAEHLGDAELTAEADAILARL